MKTTKVPADLQTKGRDAQAALARALRRGQTLPGVLPKLRPVTETLLQVFNRYHGRRYLVRLASEVVPTHPKYVSSVRARMGMLMELHLAAIWNDLIEAGTEATWRVSNNYVTEYPNLYLRNQYGKVFLRIETKALHDEADEGAARFDVPTPLIDESLDILVVVGWKWRTVGAGNRALSFPEIVGGATVSAMEIARERDRRFRALGGTFRSGGLPYVRSKKTGKWVPDPGNYGKLNRIVHSSRRQSDLSHEIKVFQALLKQVYPHRYGDAAQRRETRCL